MKTDKIQEKINAFVLRCIGWKYDKEQIIGFTMLNENIFYDEAKERVGKAYQVLKKV